MVIIYTSIAGHKLYSVLAEVAARVCVCVWPVGWLVGWPIMSRLDYVFPSCVFPSCRSKTPWREVAAKHRLLTGFHNHNR